MADLAAFGQIARSREMRVETAEQIVDGAGLHRAFSKKLDRLGIWNLVGKAEPKKSYERQSVLDDELDLVVGEIIERVQHQDPEHQHHRNASVPRPSAF